MTDASGETRERRMTVDGLEVRVLERGVGPAVVLVHGMGLTAGVWRPHIDRLADAGYHAIAPDLPGFGRSDGSRWGRSVAEVGDWLARFADAAGLDRPAWVGHSVGAQHVARLAAGHPDRAAALVLAAPTGRAGRHPLAQLGGLITTAFRERPRVVASVVRRYLAAPMVTLASWLRSLPHDLAAEAPLIGCPSLIVVGDRDPVVRASFVATLRRVLPECELRVIEGAAHAVALDPLDPFMDAIVPFLDRRYSGVMPRRPPPDSYPAPSPRTSRGPPAG